MYVRNVGYNRHANQTKTWSGQRGIHVSLRSRRAAGTMRPEVSPQTEATPARKHVLCFLRNTHTGLHCNSFGFTRIHYSSTALHIHSANMSSHDCETIQQLHFLFAPTTAGFTHTHTETETPVFQLKATSQKQSGQYDDYNMELDCRLE